MRTFGWFAVWSMLLACAGALAATEGVLEYPAGLVDIYDADESCWVGMGLSGEYPVSVVPSQWLVGPPPSELSAVTIPEDHWVDLLFSGRILNAPGDDLELTESGKAGEQAIVFLTDGAGREYVVGYVQAENEQVQALSYLSLDLPEIDIPFVPRAVRLVAVDYGGSSPGFDLGCLQARISYECGPQARYPTPVSGAVDVATDANLVWTPACDASRQYLYLSDTLSLVESGDASVRYLVEPPDANSFEPPTLRLGCTYYWRVDVVDATDSSEVSAGDIWSFTVAGHLLVENFDSYSNWTGPFLHETWHTRDRGRASLEAERVFRSCRQSLKFSYYFDSLHLSEVSRRFSPSQDWAQAGAAIMQFWVYGDRDNATDGQMYVTLSDGMTEQAALLPVAPEFLVSPEWTACRVALSDFTDVNLANVESVGMGFSRPSALSGEFGDGMVYIDDIALYPALCPAERRPAADLTGDCRVDCEDLGEVASVWLNERVYMAAVDAPNEPVLWYRFDGTASDSAGSAHGNMQGRPMYADGVHDQAIRFLNRGDAVVVSDAASIFDGIRNAVTIAFWQKGEDSSHLNDTLCCSNYVYGASNPSIAVHLGCWRRPGQYRWDCGTPWSFENRLAGRHHAESEWMAGWNHWAFTKDIRAEADGQQGRMQIFLNGVLYDTRRGTTSPIEDITSFTIGSGWYGGYDGLIDDFQIYNYALSEAEVAYLASDGTGQLQRPNGLSADLDHSNRVDLADFGILAEQWLDDHLWP